MAGCLTNHNRHVMLQRVKTYWLVGVLQESLPVGLGASLYLGISAGLAYSGLAALQQRLLSRILAHHQLAPADYIHFLDYAAERNLLRKVGGVYMFVHLLLLDYFKELGDGHSHTLKPTPKT